MRPQIPILSLLVVIAAIACGQQPNSPEASLLVNGTAGPPYPITASVPVASTATVAISGIANQPFALFSSATKLVSAGSGVFPGGIIDLPLSPPPALVFNGFQNPAFNTGPGGTFLVNVGVPAAGVPPYITLGPSAGLQAIVWDPLVFGGLLRATAATQVIVTQPPLTTTITLGNNQTTGWPIAQIGFNFPFYGVNRTAIALDSNGYLTFDAVVPSQPFNNHLLFNSGPARIAGFWTDLDPSLVGTVTLTTGTTPASTPYARVDWIGVPNGWFPATTPTFTFSIAFDANGFIQINHSGMTAPSAFETIVGISPGGNASAANPKNLAALVGTGGYSGLVNESIYGYYGNIATNPYYIWPTSNPYNLAGLTLNFLPIGAGGLPGATSRYLLY